MYEYDDFYDEPSEFEQQVDEFKQSLLNAVKDEFKTEMERLRKENAELQEIKNRKNEIEAEHTRALYQFESEKLQFENKMKRMRLAELLGENLLVAWFPAGQDIKKPKCDKCDDRRMIMYTTPRGKTEYEYCECTETSRVYQPEEIQCYKFYQSKSSWGDNYPTVSLYFQRKEDRDYDTFEARRHPYAGEPFEEVNKYSVAFNSPEECQAYCDWLNEKETREESK
ncbi:hypothetical protein [Paenibacillus macerans]|uniref:hypothetical protein n=1 Tax=Paenibacillus macerans TaxID=44252 RepID=UPI002041B79F|nr:hypothetical protein [Paenibacillus macerans]MCM3704049.1 hypothetical protein [Paenibacillus macerans]